MNDNFAFNLIFLFKLDSLNKLELFGLKIVDLLLIIKIIVKNMSNSLDENYSIFYDPVTDSFPLDYMRLSYSKKNPKKIIRNSNECLEKTYKIKSEK